MGIVVFQPICKYPQLIAILRLNRLLVHIRDLLTCLSMSICRFSDKFLPKNGGEQVKTMERQPEPRKIEYSDEWKKRVQKTAQGVYEHAGANSGDVIAPKQPKQEEEKPQSDSKQSGS